MNDEAVPTDTLTPYPGNPRRGDVQVIAGSLRNLGQYRRIVVQTSTRHILAGNHTWRGVVHNRDEDREAGITDGPFEVTHVTWADVDDDTARKIVAVDNRSADLGEYDPEALADLLSSLADPADLTVVGYSPGYLDDLLRSLNPEADDEVPRLDRRNVTDCPSCGHTFVPTTRSEVIGG